MCKNKLFSFLFFKNAVTKETTISRGTATAPVIETKKTFNLRTLSLWEIERNFESLNDEKIWFIVPTNYVRNGMLIDLNKKTIGFQKDCVPYNFTILYFVDDCLFCKIKNGGYYGVRFLVKTKTKEMEKDKDGSNQVKKLELIVIKAQNV